MVAAGELWRPFTYSFLHPMANGAFIEATLELLSLWFLGGYLESRRGGRWMISLYAASLLGAVLMAVATFEIGSMLDHPPPLVPIFGAVGGIIGLLTAIALLYGEERFSIFFFAVSVKVKYLAAVYILIAVAETFGDLRIYAFAQLGGALAALLYVRYAPRQGFGFVLSERFYGLRNQYYRWKRKRAASKFQVYMKKQGRTVRFDGQGRLIDEDDVKHDDRKRWN